MLIVQFRLCYLWNSHFLTWYIVWCRRCLCPSISMMSSGLSVVCCGVGSLRVAGGPARFRNLGVVVVVLDSVA